MQVSKYEKYFEGINEFKNMRLGLAPLNEALHALIPNISTNFIHIAGTNGKGSTSQFIASILKDSGFSTALFTSPHIISVTERIKLNLNDITINRLDELFEIAYNTIKDKKLSFFETIFLLFMMEVSIKKPDYTIIETGIGGTLDATNTPFIKEKIPVITSISQDHKEILGNKVKDILLDKLGIVGKNKIVFIAQNKPFIYDIISENLPNTECRISYSNQEIDSIYPHPFNYNYANAHNVAEYILNKKLPIKKYKLPMCRQEWIGRVMLDGAHNPSAMINLVKNNNTPFDAIILSSTKERDIYKLSSIASKISKNITITTIPHNDRSIDLNQVETKYKKIDSPEEALSQALNSTKGNILVAGSLYLCSYLRKHMVNK